MNYDTRAHMHVVPRYSFPMKWRGETYTDEPYGPLFGRDQGPASEVALDELAEVLKEKMGGRTSRPLGDYTSG
jgi:diadenosine tetraphosphate (Ap4A) HIT family hydrolase